MLFFKFIFLIIFTLILPKHVESYAYPVWLHAYDKQEKLNEPPDTDATVTEFILTSFLLPIRDSICNVCANFLEVYECILAHAEFLGDLHPPRTQSIIEKVLDYIGLYKSHDSISPPSCSYYSLLVVTIAIVLFLGLIFVTKKLVDYVKEEDKLIPQVLYDYQNKCPCYEKQ